MSSKFKITTPNNSTIEMELGQEIALTLIDEKTKVETKVTISIIEK